MADVPCPEEEITAHCKSATATLLSSVEPTARARVSFMEVKCPYCHREIDNGFIRSEVAKQMGSVKSPRKKKDPKEMARLGKLGAKNRWAAHKAKEKEKAAALFVLHSITVMPLYSVTVTL